MIKINLLREGRAATRTAAAPSGGGGGGASSGPANLSMLLLAALVGLGLVIGGGWTFFKWRAVAAKEAEVAAREDEAAKLKKIIEEVERFEKRRASLEKRIALINQLKQNQKGPVRLLDHVSRALPDLVWLDRMQLNGTQIIISGRTLNPNAAATFVENIKSDPMFDEPQFNALAAQASREAAQVYAFDMRFNIRHIEEPGAAGETTAADAGQGDAGSPQS